MPNTVNQPIKPRFPHARASEIACVLAARLAPACERLAIAGSIRRRKAAVGDIELVFVPRHAERQVPPDLFPRRADLAALAIEDLLSDGTLAKRPNKNGGFAWGGKIKLAVHVASGIPVDLFTATAENWFNYLVCRTGPAESNLAICQAAIERGWKWEPYSSGFARGHERHVVTSEREVFEFVGLEYREPHERDSATLNPQLSTLNCPQ